MSERIPPEDLCPVVCRVLMMVLRADTAYANRKWKEIEGAVEGYKKAGQKYKDSKKKNQP